MSHQLKNTQSKEQGKEKEEQPDQQSEIVMVAKASENIIEPKPIICPPVERPTNQEEDIKNEKDQDHDQQKKAEVKKVAKV